jgi:hypothetical protein
MTSCHFVRVIMMISFFLHFIQYFNSVCKKGRYLRFGMMENSQRFILLCVPIHTMVRCLECNNLHKPDKSKNHYFCLQTSAHAYCIESAVWFRESDMVYCPDQRMRALVKVNLAEFSHTISRCVPIKKC